MLKTTIVSVACCALIAPLALAKDSKQKKRTMAFVEPSVTVTAQNPYAKMALGEVADYQPTGTLVVHQDGAGRYVLDEPGHIFNRRGEAVSGTLRPGTRVQVYFATDGVSIDRVVVY